MAADNIINQIIEIDRLAQKKLDDVSQKKENLALELEQRKKEMQTEYRTKVQEQVEEEKKKRQERSRKKLARIELETQELLEQMRKRYTSSHEQWEAELLQTVLFSAQGGDEK